jgi:hypothetical protein
VLFGTRGGGILSTAAEVPDSRESRGAAAPRPRYQVRELIAAVERLSELLDSGDERVRLEAAKAILDRHLGRPAIQGDLTVRGGVSDDHLAALLEVARRRALEPIMLRDVDVEVSTTTPSTI